MKHNIAQLLYRAWKSRNDDDNDAALQHLADAANAARQDLAYAQGKVAERMAQDQSAALLLVTEMIAPADEEERGKWIAAADPHGTSTAQSFGMPDKEDAEEIAKALGTHVPMGRIAELEEQLAILRDRVGNPELPNIAPSARKAAEDFFDSVRGDPNVDSMTMSSAGTGKSVTIPGGASQEA